MLLHLWRLQSSCQLTAYRYGQHLVSSHSKLPPSLPPSLSHSLTLSLSPPSLPPSCSYSPSLSFLISHDIFLSLLPSTFLSLPLSLQNSPTFTSVEILVKTHSGLCQGLMCGDHLMVNFHYLPTISSQGAPLNLHLHPASQAHLPLVYVRACTVYA